MHVETLLPRLLVDDDNLRESYGGVIRPPVGFVLSLIQSRNGTVCRGED